MSVVPDGIAEYLAKARAAYLAAFKTRIDAAIARRPVHALAEVRPTLDGEPADLRFDLIIDTGDDMEREFIVAASQLRWPRTEAQLPRGSLRVDELVWHALTVIAAPSPSDLTPLARWFQRYLEDGAPVEPPFSGHVHYMDVTQHADGLRIDLDLGSAPVAALDELVTLLAEHGATNVWLFSEDEALAGTLPDADQGDDADGADDEDDGDMLELPDDLLDYLAEVRASYLRHFEAQLRDLPGRFALEVGAGEREGELVRRVDVLRVDDEGTPTEHEIGPGPVVSWEDGAYQLPGLELTVLTLVWPGILVLGSPAPADLTFVDEWYRRWLDEGFAVQPPFAGAVHLMSPPRRDEEQFSVLIDLGSAPVEALRDLLERCTQHGVTHVVIASGQLARGET